MLQNTEPVMQSELSPFSHLDFSDQTINSFLYPNSHSRANNATLGSFSDCVPMWRGSKRSRMTTTGMYDSEYDCHICGATLKGRQTLNDHIRVTHLSLCICSCRYCGKAFKWRSGLSNHKLICPNAPTTHATAASATELSESDSLSASNVEIREQATI